MDKLQNFDRVLSNKGMLSWTKELKNRDQLVLQNFGRCEVGGDSLE
jgi:hypothetical protein